MCEGGGLKISLFARSRSVTALLSACVLESTYTTMAKSTDSLYAKFESLPQQIRQDVIDWFKSSKEVNMFITGRSGVGKSTLVNGLVGKEVAKEGDRLDPQTSKVTGYEKSYHCVKVTVWDSPGLQDGTSREVEYLKDMKKKCSGMDICIYCVSMMETRFFKDCTDIIAMKKLTNTFGEKMWENALFVLTFANTMEDADTDILEAEDDEKPELFRAKIQMWRDTLARALIQDVGVDDRVADRIQVVPAGHPKVPALLDRDHWLSPVWFAALYAMNPRSQPALMKLNYHRIVEKPEEIRKEDLKKFIHEQPIIFSKRGAVVGERYGDREVGEAIGSDIGDDAAVEIKLVVELYPRLQLIARRFSMLIKAFISWMSTR